MLECLLRSYTREKIYFTAGREFRTLGMEGHILIISKTLYGLFPSEKWFQEVFTDML